MKPLGRRTPPNLDHVKKWSFAAVAPKTVTTVNNILPLPIWHWSHDQGSEGACVGHGSSMMMSILNGRRYDAFWLWEEAKAVDFWPDTNPGDSNGTSVSASCDVLRDKGHCRFYRGVTLAPSLAEGIQTNRWATNVDEMRTALAQGIPISLGVTWYENFDEPELVGTDPRKDYWIGRGNLGRIRGGHCVCVYGASDRRQAFRIKNSWGRDYPLVWIPYETMDKLLADYGEATLVVDR